MTQRTVNPAAIEAEVDQIRSLGIDALRSRWRMLFGAVPPKGLTKDIIGRMIVYRIQEEAAQIFHSCVIRWRPTPFPLFGRLRHALEKDRRAL